MLVVRDLQVRSLSLEYMEVSWGIAPTSEEVLDYQFQVLRGEGPMGPFTPACEPFRADHFFFIDDEVMPHRKFADSFYVVAVIDKRTGERVESVPVNDRIPPDRITLELRRHFNLVPREFSGLRCWLLPVKVSGQHCSCYSRTLQKKTRSGCLTCYDTTYIGGYHYPIETWCDIDPTSNQDQQSNVGVLQPQNTTGRTGYFPKFKPSDLLILPDNTRWLVTQVATPQHAGQVVRQELQLHMKPASSIEYSIELDLGTSFTSMFLAPPRNYTMPQQPANVDQALIAALTGIYGAR